MIVFKKTATAVLAWMMAAAAFGSSDPPGGVAALEQGFRFASAIQHDDNSKGQSQLVIVLTLAEIGELDLAMARADSVVGWQAGVAYAELAGTLADVGRTDDAGRILDKARAVRDRTEGWQGPRISAHISQALARLGDVEESRELARSVADLRRTRPGPPTAPPQPRRLR